MALGPLDQHAKIKNQDSSKRFYLIPFILVTSLFFLWGVANTLNGTLIHHFQTALNLDRSQVAFVDSAFYLGYFVMALPAGYLLKRFGYRKGFILGLLLFSLGAFLFYPAANMRAYPFFLFALFTIACGLAILETASNPYVTILGRPETSEQRLNFAQSFNGVAGVIAPVIGSLYIFSKVEITQEALAKMAPAQAEAIRIQEAHAVQMPYVVIGLVVLVFSLLFMVVKMPEIETNDPNSSEEAPASTGLWNSILNILKHRHLALGILAQFFYIGAQVSLWSFFVDIKLRLAPHSDLAIVQSLYDHEHTATPSQLAGFHASFAFILFMVGRFIGTFVMTKIKPNLVLGCYALICIALTAYGMIGEGLSAVIALMLVYFFLSVMFPTIFALATKSLGTQVKLGSSLVVASIVGGALFPILTGKLMKEGTSWALLVPFLCFCFVAFYGFTGYKVKSSS